MPRFDDFDFIGEILNEFYGQRLESREEMGNFYYRKKQCPKCPYHLNHHPFETKKNSIKSKLGFCEKGEKLREYKLKKYTPLYSKKKEPIPCSYFRDKND